MTKEQNEMIKFTNITVKVKKHLLSPYNDVYRKCSSTGSSIVVLDGIRGLAVLIVLASHTDSFGMYAQGSLGVLLFFFLSGYVLSVPFAEEPREIMSMEAIRRYSVNRILRIVPIYIVLAAVTAVMLGTDFKWYVWNISFVKGWMHFWSVAEEARFYILFPVVMALLAFVRNKPLRIVVLICLVFFAYRYRGIHKVDMMDGRHVSFYFYMFLGGCLTCFLVASSSLRRWLDNGYTKKLFSLATALIFLFLFFSSSYMIKYLWHPIFPALPENFSMNGWRIPDIWLLLFVIFFFSLTFYREGIVHSLLTKYFFRHIGLLSYSIYLVHMVVMIKLQKVGFAKEGLFVMVLAISYIVALLSYTVVEKPFLSLKNKWK